MAFVPLTGLFERPGGTNFYLPPHWELTFKPRLRFALVDTATQRIVDYVNLADCNVLDVTNALMTGGQCGSLHPKRQQRQHVVHSTRVNGGGPNALSDPTFGICNQILASAGQIASPDWNNAVVDARPASAAVLKVEPSVSSRTSSCQVTPTHPTPSMPPTNPSGTFTWSPPGRPMIRLCITC
jgi:hypothetical protein